MTRCPNCGSAVRIGAKFCTSCGFRLAVDETASAQTPLQTPTPTAAPSRSPFATTSSPAWRAEPDVVEAPAETVAPEPVVEAAWSSSGSHDDEETGDGAVAAVAATGLDDREAADDVVEVASPVDDDGPGRSWFAPAPPNTSGSISDDMIASLEADEPALSDRLSVDAVDDVDGPSETRADAPAALPTEDREVVFVSSIGTPTIDSSVSSTEAAAVEHGAPSPSSSLPAVDRPDDALGEARSLVARLSNLLSSGAFDGTGSSGGTAGSATGGVSLESIADQADVDALRSVVTSAQGRPRDVDVMLDLVLRADTIAAVIADRDLLLAALRGDEAAVEESWPTPPEQDPVDEPSTYPAWGAP